MIIAFISNKKRAGKSAAAQHIIMNNMTTWRRFSFAYRLNTAATSFLPPMKDKFEVHPELGVSMEQVNHAISTTLHELHPELPVYRTKQEIEAAVKDDLSVVIDDLRRLREITWCREIAHTYGTTFHLIEIVPVGKALERAWPDTWQNGMEPCGRDAWKDMKRSIIFNDGSSEFYDAILSTVAGLISGKSTYVIGPL